MDLTTLFWNDRCAAIPYAREVTERMDLVDEANKKLGYTVLKGDTRYKHFAATMQFSPGPSEGTTTAEWVATYVPDGDMGPPEHIKAVVLQVWKALADAANASSS